MNHIHRSRPLIGTISAALGLVLAGGALGACSGPSTVPSAASNAVPSTARSTGSSTATSAGPAAQPSADPNAPEANPAGDIPDNQVYVAYKDPAGVFTVTIPEGWAQSTTANGTAFTDKLNTIDIASSPATAAPTVASVTSKDLPGIASTATNYEAGNVKAVTRSAGNGVLATYKSDAAADPVTNKVVKDAVERYSFFHSGTQVVLTLSGPVGADNVDPWRIVTDSLTWSK